MGLKTIMVDDDVLALGLFERECREWDEIELVGKFENAEEALIYAENHIVQFAVLDICLSRADEDNMEGIELGKSLRRLNPDVILVYLTGHSEYLEDAVKSRPDCCIMKPYSREDVEDALMRGRLLAKRFRKRMFVQTFGRFEIYVDGRPVYFGNGKARELFAYCINRNGATVSMAEATDILWPDRPYDERVKRLYRKAIIAICATLERLQMQNVFVNNRGCCYVEKKEIECDLYKFLEGDYMREFPKLMSETGYMLEYDWAEAGIRKLIARAALDAENTKRTRD